jgi:hypothetical protein
MFGFSKEFSHEPKLSGFEYSSGGNSTLTLPIRGGEGGRQKEK